MEFGLPDRTINSLHEILQKHPKIEKAVIYGSRAKGNYRIGSDIDLTLFGAKLDYQDLMTINYEISESTIPYLVDLSIFNLLVNADLREHIMRVGKELWCKKSI